MKETILVVEDHPLMADNIQKNLEYEGFFVECVRTGEEALKRVESTPPNLVLLDIMLPGMDGWEVCRRIRAREGYIPIIMLTARGGEVDRIVGLELGADDYVCKSGFTTRELAARVRAVLRLVHKSQGKEDVPRIVIDDRLQIDLAGREVWVDDQPKDLRPKEFDLLAFMARHRGTVFDRDILLNRVWGYDFLGHSRTVDVHIQRLRSKIEPDANHPRYILTVRSIGYKFSQAN
jgi:two-component system alkaline phosphatase synthesis response regulator PhoP